MGTRPQTGLSFDRGAARRAEAIYETEGVARRLGTVLNLLQLAPGERVFDKGTGPGYMARKMVDAVGPTGAVVGVDNSRPMLGLARSRCEATPAVRFEFGDATRLPVPDGAFDAVACVQVLEYVPDVENALREMRRSIRPGGRGIIISTDWKSIAWVGDDEQLMKGVLSAFEEHCVHLDLPRRIGPLASSTGLRVTGQRSIPQFETDYGPNSFSRYLAAAVCSFVPGHQGVEDDDAKQWAEGLQRAGEAGRYFFALNQYLCVVERLS